MITQTRVIFVIRQEVVAQKPHRPLGTKQNVDSQLEMSTPRRLPKSAIDAPVSA